MFDFIVGNVIDINDEYVVLQSNNIGYRIYTSQQSMLELEVGMEDVLLNVELIVRDDAILLYGFTSKEEKEMFNLLILVSRIGPKVAIGILSSLSSNKIKLAIINNQLDILCQAPGIGKKTAERLVLELKDRINPLDIKVDGEVNLNLGQNNREEAILGLVSLGYTRYEVEKSIKDLDIDEMDVEDIIRAGLKSLSS